MRGGGQGQRSSSTMGHWGVTLGEAGRGGAGPAVWCVCVAAGRCGADPALVYCGLGGPGAPAQLPLYGDNDSCDCNCRSGCRSRAGPHRHPATRGRGVQRWQGLGGPREVVWGGGQPGACHPTV